MRVDASEGRSEMGRMAGVFDVCGEDCSYVVAAEVAEGSMDTVQRAKLSKEAKANKRNTGQERRDLFFNGLQETTRHNEKRLTKEKSEMKNVFAPASRMKKDIRWRMLEKSRKATANLSRALLY